jgi:hypothetical protein
LVGKTGHTPGLLRDHTGITPLEATGLPLGFFSHMTALNTRSLELLTFRILGHIVMAVRWPEE